MADMRSHVVHPVRLGAHQMIVGQRGISPNMRGMPTEHSNHAGTAIVPTMPSGGIVDATYCMLDRDVTAEVLRVSPVDEHAVGNHCKVQILASADARCSVHLYHGGTNSGSRG